MRQTGSPAEKAGVAIAVDVKWICHCKAVQILTEQKAEAGVLPAFPSGGETAQRPARAGRRFGACARAAQRYRLCDLRQADISGLLSSSGVR